MNPEFDIIETTSYKVIRWGELVAELTADQHHIVAMVATLLPHNRIAGIKLLRATSRIQAGDPWGLKCCRDLLDAARAQL